MQTKWLWKSLPALLLLLIALPALAGGAATVVLDELPAEVRAGTSLHLGFTVYQHAQHPVHFWDGVGPVEPVLTARNMDTGEIIQAPAEMDAGVPGHFFVDVTFPSEGTWQWSIQPEPFELMNTFEPLVVLPAAAAAPAPTPAAAPDTLQTALAAAGAILLLAAAGLAVMRRRQPASPPAPAEAH